MDIKNHHGGGGGSGTTGEVGTMGTATTGEVSIIGTQNMNNQVDRPSHYQLGQNRQVIDILAETLTSDELRGFILGNVIKYVTRSAYKGKELEDLHKAMWYLNWYINKINKE